MKVQARRILHEKRAIVIPLAIAFLANIAVTAFYVYPLATRARDAQSRAAASESALRGAQREFDDAQKTKTSQERATQELQRFYREVLPADLSGARRITYLPLAQLARKYNLKPEHRNASPEMDHDSHLGRLKVTMVVQGDYANVRKFIHALETAPEFVVIDDVSLAQGAEPSSPLVLTLGLSTYYRVAGNGN
jgi:hypothetical protein